MKTISVALKAHLAQQYHRLATCWLVTLTNGVVKAFTDHDQNIVFDVNTYLATSGYVASDVSSTAALNVDTLEVQGMLEAPSITEDDLRAGLWDFAAIEIFMVNWSDLTQGRLYLRCGTLGEVTTSRLGFAAELRGLAQAYSRAIGELTSPTCRARLGDSRCQVDLVPLTVTGTVDSVNPDNMTIYDAARVEPGPAGGIAIDDVTPVGVRTRISVDPPLDLIVTDGQVITLSGIQGPVLLNGMHIAHDPLGGFEFWLEIDTGDTAIYPAHVFGTGVMTPLGAESGWFDGGVLTWVTGLNAGLRREVKAYVPGIITLVLPMPYAIAAGDEYLMTPGCNKIFTTCRDKYSNIVNFRGEPFLGGMDKLMQVGRRG